MMMNAVRIGPCASPFRGRSIATHQMSNASCVRRQAGSLRSPDPSAHRQPGFTLLELLIVISIIIILAGLVLATSAYVQKKGYRSRAETEIAAMSAALESYKADNGIYPRDTSTDTLDPKTHFNPDPSSPSKNNAYFAASLSLYNALASGSKSYFSFQPRMLGGARDSSGNIVVAYLKDPFGFSYGYSTINQVPPNSGGYNPTFDLWSTAGGTQSADQVGWIKNW